LFFIPKLEDFKADTDSVYYLLYKKLLRMDKEQTK
jgi:hypothetical protein